MFIKVISVNEIAFINTSGTWGHRNVTSFFLSLNNENMIFIMNRPNDGHFLVDLVK